MEYHYTQLIEKYLAGNCTEEEKAIVETWVLHLVRNNKEVPSFEVIQSGREKLRAILEQRVATASRGKSRKHKINTSNQRISKLNSAVKYWTIAAGIALVLSTGMLIYLLSIKPISSSYVYNKAHDIPAGGNNAILTLADGKKIDLAAAQNGTVATQDGVMITKKANGQVIYAVTGLAGEDGNRFNTISTPKGGQYKVMLPDGSMAFLNAASILKYPVRFTAGERKVELSGEGYFEVAKRTNQPFLVASAGQTVKVLGTHFNIECYPGQPIKTTLAEGKVEVNVLSKGISIGHERLVPGQQAIHTGNSMQIKTVNPDDVIAWKDGLFAFTQTPIKELLQQISRWYDVEVDYTTLPDKYFDGEISRNQPLSEILKAIEQNNQISFKIEGRRISIQK